MPAMLAPLAMQAAGTLIQGGIQSIFNQGEHRRNLTYYNMQRQDALNDWRMNNAYNDPSAQVERLKKAGFSPYHVGGAQSVVAGGIAKQLNAPRMADAPRAYQVNQATNTMNMQLGLEQLNNLRVQNEKLRAETESVKEDTRAKQLSYSVDSETKRSLAIGQIWLQDSLKKLQDASYTEKTQQVENMKTQLLESLEDLQFKRTQNIYSDDYLKGRNKMQTLEMSEKLQNIERIKSEVKNINARTDSEIKKLPFELKDIVQRIEQLKLDNEKRNYENVYMPENLRQRNEGQQIQNKLSKNQLDYLETLPPELRFTLEKAPQLLEQVMKARFFRNKSKLYTW